MLDLPGVVFVGAACFVVGMVLVDVFWDTRVLEASYDEESAAAINAFYRNNLIGMRRRAPYLIALFPLGFLVLIAALVYKLVQGLNGGDAHAVLAAGVSIAVLFPLIGLAGVSTFPTIGRLVAQGDQLGLDELRRLHRRLLFQHLAYLVLTAAAVVLHVAL